MTEDEIKPYSQFVAMLKDANVTMRIKDITYFKSADEGEVMKTIPYPRQTYKHLIEYDGHTWLIESTFGFQQMTFDPKDGYVPHLAGFHMREINLKEEEEKEPEKPTEDQIRNLFLAKLWAMKTDSCIKVYVTGFDSTKSVVKYLRVLETNYEEEKEQCCSFRDFFMMFEPWKEIYSLKI